MGFVSVLLLLPLLPVCGFGPANLPCAVGQKVASRCIFEWQFCLNSSAQVSRFLNG